MVQPVRAFIAQAEDSGCFQHLNGVMVKSLMSVPGHLMASLGICGYTTGTQCTWVQSNVFWNSIF